MNAFVQASLQHVSLLDYFFQGVSERHCFCELGLEFNYLRLRLQQLLLQFVYLRPILAVLVRTSYLIYGLEVVRLYSSVREIFGSLARLYGTLAVLQHLNCRL